MDAIVYEALSERELEIVGHLNDGLTNREIADRTGLTLYTVKWYLKQMYSKLYVSNRTQAASKARELGLLDEEVEAPTHPEIKTSLPEMLTPFYGRTTELERLETWLTDDVTRLITLHAAGGMGKTRLALEAAHRFQSEFADGVFFVALGAERNNPLFTITELFQLASDSMDDVLSDLSAFLQDKRCLLLLDNFEHLTSYSSQLTALLEQTKYLKIMVTSREVLRVKSEVVFPLLGLHISTDIMRVEDSAAYQLYLQRAQSAFPEFEPDKAEQETIGKICDLLGGMPLAIEIAAGWTAVLTVDDTLERLQSSLDLLTSDEQDRPERHQSIRATFDYSWNLLSAPAQETLISLGVFDVTGFTFDAAEKIANANPVIIKQLTDKALIQRHDQRRFAFHPLIRQYVRDRLKANRDLHQLVKTRFSEYYFALVMEQIEGIRKQIDLRYVRRVAQEMYNLYFAWRVALEQGRLDWIEAAAEVGYILEALSLWREAEQLFGITMGFVPEDYTIIHGRLSAFRAIYAYRAYDIDKMREYGLRSWELLKDTPYALDAGAALAYLAVAESFLGDTDKGFDMLEKAESLLERDNLPSHVYAEGMIRGARPTFLLYADQPEEALPLLKAFEAEKWHEFHIHLPECYIELDMIHEAWVALENLYDAALDHKRYKSAVYATFYLTVIDQNAYSKVSVLAYSLSELTLISGHYPTIAKHAHYFGTLLTMRGYHEWGRLMFLGNIHMLYKLKETSWMYYYGLRVARALSASQPERSAEIYALLAHDTHAPAEIRAEARSKLGTGVLDGTHTTFITTIDKILA